MNVEKIFQSMLIVIVGYNSRLRQFLMRWIITLEYQSCLVYTAFEQ